MSWGSLLSTDLGRLELQRSLGATTVTLGSRTKRPRRRGHSSGLKENRSPGWGLRPNSAGIPYTLLLRIEAMWFPTFELLLYAAGDAAGDVLMSKSREVTDNC